MDDQGKRLLLLVGVMVVVYVGWSQFFAPKPPPEVPAAPAVAQPAPAVTPPGTPAAIAADPAAATQAASTQPGAATQAAGSQPAAAPVVKACEPETENAPEWETNDYIATFSRCGGALRSFRLKGAQYHTGERDDGPPIDLVSTSSDAISAVATPDFYPFQVQVEASAPGTVDKLVPIIDRGSTWQVVSATPDQIVFSWTSPDKGLEVTKTYHKLAGRYIFGLDLEVKNLSQTDKRNVETGLTLYGYQNPNAPGRSIFHYAEPPWGTACYVDGSLKDNTLKNLGEGQKSYTSDDVRWFGITHQYFLLAAAPLEKDPVRRTCTSELGASASGGVMQAKLELSPPQTMNPKDPPLRRSFVIYAGPKLLGELEAVNTVAGKETKLDAAVDLGWFAIIARPMLSLLKFFQRWVSNWGVAIILLTIAVKLLTLYWTSKSMRSMKAMSRLKPELDKIKERYKDDKAKQNTEMMNLYKTHNISPLGGCLPMLLQMPVWFALYRTLGAAAELYHTPFVGWIHDLTAPDPLKIFPVTLAGLMFIQARLQPAAVDSGQQKMMQYMMPVMFGAFALVFPAGLAVYMMTNTLLGLGHQYYMNKTDKGLVIIAKPEVVKPTDSDAGPGERRPPHNRPRKNKRPAAKA